MKKQEKCITVRVKYAITHMYRNNITIQVRYRNSLVNNERVYMNVRM